jgi:hypothetical protein
VRYGRRRRHQHAHGNPQRQPEQELARHIATTARQAFGMGTWFLILRAGWLTRRPNVRCHVIDLQPETHLVGQFALGRSNVWGASYGDQFRWPRVQSG